MYDTFQSGAVLDTRPPEEKRKDFKFEELVAAAAPVTWVEKPQNSWRKFPIFNQDGSGSCVAQTMAKILGVLYWLKNNVYVHFSATHIYQRRANKPNSGMAGVDCFQIAQKGTTLEVLTPSQNMNDSEMDGTLIEKYKQDVGEIFKIGNYLTVPIKDIDTVASIIEKTNKAVMVWFFFENSEWTKEVPIITNPNLDLYAPSTARHSVTAVDYTMYQGKKALIIEDSWGFWNGFSGQRVITEDFFKERNFFAAYPMNFAFDSVIVKPQHNFLKVLTFGMKDPDVAALQDVLKYEGLFPTNVDSTGLYGAVTAKGVLAFQKKYKVAPDSELDPLGGRRVGVKTLAKLNELYG